MASARPYSGVLATGVVCFLSFVISITASFYLSVIEHLLDTTYSVLYHNNNKAYFYGIVNSYLKEISSSSHFLHILKRFWKFYKVEVFHLKVKRKIDLHNSYIICSLPENQDAYEQEVWEYEKRTNIRARKWLADDTHE